MGNSRGVIIPKRYFDQCGIEDKVDIIIQDKKIMIVASRNVKKKKWSDFRQPKGRIRIGLLKTNFDEKDWTW